MDCTDYAIWWVPRPDSGLARFGLEWTGWCADRGVTAPRRALAALSRPRAGVPGAGRLTGLHAALRSPFRLAAGRSRWALEDALAGLAGRTSPIRLPRLRLAVEGGRVMLAPMRPNEALTRLVTELAEALLPFDVPAGFAALSGEGAGAGFVGRGAVAAGGLVLADRPDRRPDRRPGQRAGGAPAPERFALALTDRMDPAAAAEIAAELAPALGPQLLRTQALDDLALVGDPGRGRPWRVLERYALEGGAASAPRLPDTMACSGPSLMTPLLDPGRAAA